MSKFQVGDVVRRKSVYGDVKTVVTVKKIGGTFGDRMIWGDDDLWTDEDGLVLVTAAPAPKEDASKTWIISLLEGGKLKPAHEPKTYTAEAQAHRVAKEMAEKHRGSTFVVFEATGFIHVPVAPSVEVTRL